MKGAVYFKNKKFQLEKVVGSFSLPTVVLCSERAQTYMAF